MIESARFVNKNGAQVIFNDDNVPFRRFSMAVDTRTTERNKGQQHGIWPSYTYLGKRVFSCEGDLLLNTSAEYMAKRMQIMNAIMPRNQLGYFASGTLFVRFSGIAEEMQAECSIDGWPEIPMEALAPARSPYLINFKSFDPKLYGETRTWNLTLENPTGRSYPKTYNLAYPASSLTNEAVLTNAGNIETFPTVRIYGPCTNPGISLRISLGNRTFDVRSVGVTLAESQWLDIDMGKPSVTMSDGSNGYSKFVGSQWWALEPSPIANTVRFFADSWTPPARAEVSWRNAYMP